MIAILTWTLLLPPAVPVETQASSGAEHLKPLSFLIGTWTGEGESPTFGKYTVEHVFEWIHDRNFIKSEMVMNGGGKVVWSATTFMGYDVKKKKFVQFVFARNGAVAQGEGAASEEKDAWVFENRVTGLGTLEEDRVNLRKVDEDTFASTVEVKKEGKYQLLGKYTYRRKK